MYVEISVAVNYILSHLYTKLPRRRVDSFGEELEKYLHAKFQHHWFPNDPYRDTTYRCINAAGLQVDLLLPEAAAVSGLEWSEIQACLPEGLTISVDPGHVACHYHQQSCSVPDRFSNSSIWPSSSVSLSSSGCSSASSSISSSNLSSNPPQLTHQILYCLQNEWSQPISDNRFDALAMKTTQSENDHGDMLATAAALSVLVEPDEGIDNKIDATAMYGLSPSLADQPHWNSETPATISSPLINDDVVSIQTQDMNLKCVNLLQSEPNFETDLTTPAFNYPWPISESENDSSLLPIINSDVNIPSGTIDSTIFNGKSQTFPLFHRSSSNPPQQTEQLSLTNLSDYLTISSTNVNNNPLLQTRQSKYDQSMNILLNQITPKSYPNYIQALNSINSVVNSSTPTIHNASTHLYVQKSTSTPSFTAATFAQTKFGSTKLKTHTKRTPNRILSPTTIQQTFTAVTTNNLLTNETINNNFISNNQRFANLNSTNVSAFKRFLPLNIELNSIKNTSTGSPNIESLIASNECHSIKSQDNNNLNPSSDFKLFPISLQQNNYQYSMNNLENYITHSSDETSPNRLLEHFNLPETHCSANPSDLWHPYVSHHSHDDNDPIIKQDNTHLIDLGLCSAWTDRCPTSTVPYISNNVDLIENDSKSNFDTYKSPSINFDLNTMRLDEHGDGLLDEALISTRMVNLLLEEDNTSIDPIPHSNLFITENTSLIQENQSSSTNTNYVILSGDDNNNIEKDLSIKKHKESNSNITMSSTNNSITDNLQNLITTEAVESF